MTRDDIDRMIAAGQPAAAAEALKGLLREAPQATTASFAVSRFEQIASSLRLIPLKIAFLRSFTIEPLIPFLRAQAYAAGIDAKVMVGNHNVIAQELLVAGSLDAFAPDIVVVAALTRDVAPALWNGEGDQASAADSVAAEFSTWVSAFRNRNSATIIVQSLEQPAYATDGLVDGGAGAGQRRGIQRANDAIATMARSHRGVYVLDYDALVSRHGRASWGDPHKDLAMRVPLTADAYAELAGEYLRFLHALSGRTCKVLAVDLDQTLWGGVIGEDGIEGIKLGVEYPGSAFLAFQRALKALSRRGVLLAICSKNNRAEAMDVLEKHPEMLLRASDFSAIRINWDDKAANLRAIAAELNVGLDAVAFFDDNPAEREWVRAQAPEVRVIDVPGDPVRYVEALRATPVFERLELSAEDRARAEQYRQQQARAGAASASGSIEAFLTSLEMKAELADVTPATLTRVAQLTQKTNQFNVTTRRYTEEQISRFAGDRNSFVRTIRVRDKYGDNGLVGVAIGKTANGQCEIDTLLLSCRVIGRTVETVLLSDVAAIAKQRGASTLVGRFLPTPKNAPASQVFGAHGFVKRDESADGSRWEFDLGAGAIAAPNWFDITT